MTLESLYTQITGDQATAAEIRKALRFANTYGAERDGSTLSMVTEYVHGATLRELGKREGISHGAVQSRIRLALLAAHKAIRGLPRYSLRGRELGRGYGPKPKRKTAKR